jgi:hypothetical protein
MRKRTAGILVTVIAATAGLAPAAMASASVATKIDPCKLITASALGALAKPYSLESATPITKLGCEYQLRGTGSNDAASPGPVILSLETLKIHKINKAIVHKLKSVSGLGAGAYQAIDGAGEPVVGFQGKKQGVTLAGGFDAPTLIAIAKTFNTQIK